ncbi:MAG TPA: LamG-like jellyroll fold domain-containing protein [Schlesneria sp.]|jgi:hypothetical protein
MSRLLFVAILSSQIAFGALLRTDSKCFAEEPGAKGSFELEFNGADSYVAIPKLRYDGSTPLTLEAFVTPFPRNPQPRRSCVLGNVELSGLALHHKADGWYFHVNDGRDDNGGYASTGSIDEPLVNHLVHLAGVCAGKKVRIFVDGKVQDDADMINPHKMSVFDFMVGADPDKQGNPHQFFRGTIDEVRISKVARYDRDFMPPKDRFPPDADTLVLYHFDEGDGDVAKDASGNNYDGQIHGAKWIKLTK